MDINKIKYLPKTNAFGDVYTKATGMPFVGEMMVAAAGNGGEPTPPTPTQKAEAPTYTYSQDTTYCSNYDVTLYGDLTVNLATTTPNATIHLREWYVDPPVTAEDFDWNSLYGPWRDLSSYTYNRGGDVNYNAIMIAYASADGMENSDYTYITLPYQHTEATTCDEIKPVYDLKFEYGGSGEIMNVTAKTLTDLTLNKIHFGGMVDIQLVQNDPSDNTLTLDTDYPNMMDNLYDPHISGQLTISNQDGTEVVYSGDLDGVVIPYVEVMSVDVTNAIPDNYDIQLNLNVMPQEWMMDIDFEGTFEGCEETLMFNKRDDYNAHYDGQANFVDGGTYTLTDVERTLTLTGTYTFTPLT